MKRRVRPKGAPRLPIEGVLRAGSSPQTTKKGKKGYKRKELKRQLRALIRENHF